MEKILILGMADSVHLANWLENMSSIEAEVILVSSSPHRNIHPQISKMLDSPVDQKLKLRMPRWSRRFGLALWAIDRIFGERVRGRLVRRLIESERPKLIHAVEFQHAGYILLRALKEYPFKKSFSIVVSNYGSDIYWFQKYPRHKARILSLLSNTDVYTSECTRDIALAENLGLTSGSVLIPNTGGIDYPAIKEYTTKELCSARKLVVIKGYQGKFGRAVSGVLALWREREALKGFTVVSFSTNLVTALALLVFRHFSGLKVTIHLKGRLSHKEVLGLMSRARVYIGLSRSDGISTSLLEAMAMGAFPIQTGTSCANEWIAHGETGAIVGLEGSSNLRYWIKAAVQNASLVDSAQKGNASTISERYTKLIIKARVESFYNEHLKREIF